MREKAAALADTRAGWVTRRDAAEWLGEAAVQAIAALREHTAEEDKDVRAAVERAIERVNQAMAGAPVEPLGYRTWKPQGGEDRAGTDRDGAPRTRYTLEELAQACVKPKVREVTEDKSGYRVHVRLKSGRSQTVYISPFTRRDGVELVRVYTRCGKPMQNAFGWALRANMKIAQGALAIAKEQGEEELVLTNTYILDEVSPREIKASVKEVAFYGDWVESKLSALDEL